MVTMIKNVSSQDMGWQCTRRQEKPFKAIKTKKQGGLSAKPLNAINQAVSYQAEKVRTSFFSLVPEQDTLGQGLSLSKINHTINSEYALVPGVCLDNENNDNFENEYEDDVKDDDQGWSRAIAIC